MQHLRTLAKISISIGLMGYLVVTSDPQKILDTLSNIYKTEGLYFFSLAIVFLFISLFLMAIRWKIILKKYGYEIPLQKLLGFYVIGLFFNNFLPTGIGGDVIRIYKVAGVTNERATGFASVIIERMIGIAATLFLAITSLYYVSHYFKDDRILYISVALFSGIVGMLFIITRKRPVAFLINLFGKVTILKIGEKINKLIEAIGSLKEKKRTFLNTFYLSVLSQLAIVAMNFMAAKALDIEIDFMYLLLVVPITIILTMLPSINGLGVRDGGFVFLLGKIGISGAAAISLSFMNILIPMLISIWGGILLLIQRKQTNFKEVSEIEKSI